MHFKNINNGSTNHTISKSRSIRYISGCCEYSSTRVVSYCWSNQNCP